MGKGNRKSGKGKSHRMEVKIPLTPSSGSNKNSALPSPEKTPTTKDPQSTPGLDFHTPPTSPSTPVPDLPSMAKLAQQTVEPDQKQEVEPQQPTPREPEQPLPQDTEVLQETSHADGAQARQEVEHKAHEEEEQIVSAEPEALSEMEKPESEKMSQETETQMSPNQLEQPSEDMQASTQPDDSTSHEPEQIVSAESEVQEEIQEPLPVPPETRDQVEDGQEQLSPPEPDAQPGEDAQEYQEPHGEPLPVPPETSDQVEDGEEQLLPPEPDAQPEDDAQEHREPHDAAPLDEEHQTPVESAVRQESGEGESLDVGQEGEQSVMKEEEQLVSEDLEAKTLPVSQETEEHPTQGEEQLERQEFDGELAHVSQEIEEQPAEEQERTGSEELEDESLQAPQETEEQIAGEDERLEFEPEPQETLQGEQEQFREPEAGPQTPQEEEWLVDFQQEGHEASQEHEAHQDEIAQSDQHPEPQESDQQDQEASVHNEREQQPQTAPQSDAQPTTALTPLAISAKDIASKDITAIADLFATMKMTLSSMTNAFDRIGAQTEKMVSLSLNIKAADQLRQIKITLEDQITRQKSDVETLRHSLQTKIKEAVEEKMRLHLRDMIRDSIKTKIEDQVREQLAIQIPEDLRQQVISHQRQIIEVKTSLHNSEARRYNALQTIPGAVLRPLLRPLPTPEQSPVVISISRSSSMGNTTLATPASAFPQGPAPTPIRRTMSNSLRPPGVGPGGGGGVETVPPTPSRIFPRDLTALFALSQEEARRLLREYGLSSATPSPAVEHLPRPRGLSVVNEEGTAEEDPEAHAQDMNTFMAHIGVPFLMIPPPKEKFTTEAPPLSSRSRRKMLTPLIIK